MSSALDTGKLIAAKAQEKIETQPVQSTSVVKTITGMFEAD